MQILRNPTPKSAKKLLDDSIKRGLSCIIVGSCTVDYSGRAGSFLPEGERIIITKPDGTLLVHQNEKREPVNWNPPGCEAETQLADGNLKLISRRKKPEELLVILLKDTKAVLSFELVDDEEIQLIGTEEDLVNSVLENPEIIEEGFEPKKKEKSMSSGLVDLYGEDSKGNGVAIEFKRGKATLSAVGQLDRYVNELEEKVERNVRGIIAAPKITSGAKNLLKAKELEYVKVEKMPEDPLEKAIYDRRQRRIKEYFGDSEGRLQERGGENWDQDN